MKPGIQRDSEMKYTNLVVKTDQSTTFDSRWSEIKIEGRNISSRSNHIAAFFDSKLYIHGGYDVDKGVLPDFHCIDLGADLESF